MHIVDRARGGRHVRASGMHSQFVGDLFVFAIEVRSFCPCGRRLSYQPFQLSLAIGLCGDGAALILRVGAVTRVARQRTDGFLPVL